MADKAWDSLRLDGVCWIFMFCDLQGSMYTRKTKKMPFLHFWQAFPVRVVDWFWRIILKNRAHSVHTFRAKTRIVAEKKNLHPDIKKKKLGTKVTFVNSEFLDSDVWLRGRVHNFIRLRSLLRSPSPVRKFSEHQSCRNISIHAQTLVFSLDKCRSSSLAYNFFVSVRRSDSL
jgi:hypothetical protein